MCMSLKALLKCYHKKMTYEMNGNGRELLRYKVLRYKSGIFTSSSNSSQIGIVIFLRRQLRRVINEKFKE